MISKQIYSWIFIAVVTCATSYCYSQDSMVWIPQPLFDSIAIDAIRYQGCKRTVDYLDSLSSFQSAKISTLRDINTLQRDKIDLLNVEVGAQKTDIAYLEKQYKQSERQNRWLKVQRSIMGGVVLTLGIIMLWQR